MELYLDSRQGLSAGGALTGVYFLLSEPIIAPLGCQLTLQVTSATVPLTHWALHDGNNDLHLIYSDLSEQFISLLEGNRSIDLVITKLNMNLLHGWVASYDETTNLVTFSAGTLGLSIGPMTNCQTALGVVIGDVSGVDLAGTSPVPMLVGRNGVDISGTACFFVRTNLFTQNSIPLSNVPSSVIGRIPITRAPNDIERFVNQSPFVNTLSSDFIGLIYVELLDDQCRFPIELHGGHWSITILFGNTPQSDYLQKYNMDTTEAAPTAQQAPN